MGVREEGEHITRSQVRPGFDSNSDITINIMSKFTSKTTVIFIFETASLEYLAGYMRGSYGHFTKIAHSRLICAGQAFWCVKTCCQTFCTVRKCILSLCGLDVFKSQFCTIGQFVQKLAIYARHCNFALFFTPSIHSYGLFIATFDM